MEIEKLNGFIHENLVNRRNATPYGLLRNIAEQMTFGIKIPDRRFPAIKQKMEIDRAKKIVLDFFKSVDEQWYEKAKAIIEGKSEFEFHIYYKDEISPRLMDTKRQDGLPLYSSFGCLHSNKNGKGIYVPCERSIRDVFILAHEISHSFDYREIDPPARNLLGEVTSYTFEAMLQQYLLEQNLISREDATNMEKANIISHYDDAVETYAKLMLMRIKESRGPGSRITEEDLAQIQQKYHISDGTFDYILGRMMGKLAVPEVDYRARYMIAQLVYPYIMEQYYNNPQETVVRMKHFFEATGQNDLERALLSLGIEPKDESIPMLIECNNRRIERLYRKKLFDAQEKTANLKKEEPFFQQSWDEPADD